MKKSLKKYVAILLILFTVSILSACKKEPENPPQPVTRNDAGYYVLTEVENPSGGWSEQDVKDICGDRWYLYLQNGGKGEACFGQYVDITWTNGSISDGEKEFKYILSDNKLSLYVGDATAIYTKRSSGMPVKSLDTNENTEETTETKINP